MTAVNNNAIAEWKAGLTTYWRDAITAGELPETDLDIGVGSLMTMMVGLQVTAVLGAGESTDRVQIALLDSILGVTSEPSLR
ncbi:hypothetical protein GYA93_15925 [Gordonia desulfuricans]|uniref:TetR/AcrR family transcriptional regulator n=1 Tax=Gordonia desulfuricans TaxID=89051 RepID=A0A7K3LS30_9ACTN|nr:hypothetical protein [Gordonia desulfuricans]NDK91058.1 hypothetical protein [Gordonia desulfuricans]